MEKIKQYILICINWVLDFITPEKIDKFRKKLEDIKNTIQIRNITKK